MNSGVREQAKARCEVSFPKSSKSLIMTYQIKTLVETALAVKSTHLAFNFYHFKRRRGCFTEKTSETDAHEALRVSQPVVFFNYGHPCSAFL